MRKRQLGPTTNLLPMPALLVAVRTGVDQSGAAMANVLTVAWAGVVCGSPPVLALEIGQKHYSTPHIAREGNFTVNVPRSGQYVGVDYCGLVSGREDGNKIATCGWSLAPSTRISSPLIVECPLNLECHVLRLVEVGSGGVFYLAEVIETHVDEEALGAGGKLDAGLLDPLIFTPDGQYHRLGERLGGAWQAGKALRKRAPAERPG